MKIELILNYLDTLAGKYDFMLADERRMVPPGILFEFSQYGLFGLQIDKKYGGLDLSYADTAKIIEKLASINLTLATIVTTHANGIYSIFHYGKEELKKEYLPCLVKGNGLAGFALTEESAGSNVLSITSSASQIEENKWLVNGKKIWVDSGAWSSVIVMFCKAEVDNNRQKFMAFAVPTSVDGVKILEESYTMGLRAMVQNQVEFNNVVLAQTNLLGQGSDGLIIANAALNVSRFLLSIKALGASKRALGILINYAKNRYISTGLLFDNPVITNIISELGLKISALDMMCKKLSSLYDTKISIPPEILMMVKVYASELVNFAADNALQVLGGRGYMEQNFIPQIMRDARSLKISEGANESLNSHVGTTLVYAGHEIEIFIKNVLKSDGEAKKLHESCKNIFDSYIAQGVDNNWAYYIIGQIAGYHLFRSISVNDDLLFEFFTLQIEKTIQQGYTQSQLFFKSTNLLMAIAKKQVSGLPGLHPTFFKIENTPDKLITGKTTNNLAILHGNNLERDGTTNIAQLITQKFTQYNDKTALVCLDKSITYAQLFVQVNQTANSLILKGIRPGDIVGVCINHSIELVVTLLSLLKIGGAYLPLDPNYPENRLQYIVEDSRITQIITTNNLKCMVEKYAEAIIPDLSSDANCDTVNDPSLAYIIYTSGSTGKPKGVCIKHNAVINFLLSMQNLLGVDESEVFMLQTSISFDIAALEIFLPLLIGAKLVIVPPNMLYDRSRLLPYIEENKISLIQATPSLWHMLIDYGYSGHQNLTAISGGEAIHPALAQKIKGICGKLWNLYGPTEATIWATGYLVEDAENVKNIPIGRPLDNLNIFILDEYNDIMQGGSSGEICISGVALAEGYLYRQELTEEKFISLNDGTIVYKTGDVGYIDTNGQLINAGRKDRQVKCNGYRIELGEIEHNLLLNEQIDSVAVVKLEDENHLDILVAYYVSKGNEIGSAELREYLKQFVPDFMLPNLYISLEKLPLTLNKKIDYRALPQPSFEVKLVESDGNILSTILAVWNEAFRRQDIRNSDNFFELGGNSLIALKISSRLRKQLNCSISLSDIFLHPTINELSKLIHDYTVPAPSILQGLVPESGHYPLSYIQEYFVRLSKLSSNAFNNHIVGKLAEDIDLDVLEQSLQSIMERHEVLRSYFKTDVNGMNYQEVQQLSAAPFSVKRLFVEDKAEMLANLPEELYYNFKLDKEYSLRALIAGYSGDKYLIITTHHINTDGWSTDIFIRELETYYRYYLQIKQHIPNPILNLNKLSIQYKDFALWRRNYVNQILPKRLKFWKDKLHNRSEFTLPTDFPRQSKNEFIGDVIKLNLGLELSVRLHELATEYKTTIYIVLLSGYYLFLRKITLCNDIVIGTVSANRPNEQLFDMQGSFANKMALRKSIDSSQKLSDYLVQTRDELIIYHMNQDLPFIKLLEELDIVIPDNKHPLFQIMFTVQSFGKFNDSKIFNTNPENNLVDEIESLYKANKYDLLTMIDDSKEELSGFFMFDTNLYNSATITKFIEEYKLVLISMLGNKDGTIDNVV